MNAIHRFRFIFLLIVGLLLVSSSLLFAQKSRQQLEKEKRENLERLQELQGILKQTTEQKRASLGQLKAIKQQINAQNRKIELINDDLQLMDSELNELQKAKVELDNDLGKLRAEYGKMIYNSSKRNNSLNELSFLFSAPNFNQFVIRYKYLKQYTDERKKQVDQMKKVQSLMIAKTNSITNKKKDQQNALQTRIAESKNLEQLKGEKDKVVKEFMPIPKKPGERFKKENEYFMLRQNEGKISLENYIGEQNRRLKKLLVTEQPGKNSLTLNYEDFTQLNNYLFPYTSLIQLIGVITFVSGRYND